MKRVVFLVAALFFCTSSVFAWNAESFTNGVYEYEPVMAMSTFILDRGVAVASASDSFSTFSFTDLIPRFSSSSKIGIYCLVDHPEQTIAGITIPGFQEQRIYPDTGSSISTWSDGSTLSFQSPNMSVPSTLNGGDVISIGSSVFSIDSKTWTNIVYVDVDLSGIDTFSAFSLSGILTCDSTLNDRSTYLNSLIACPLRFQILVNGVIQKDMSIASGYDVEMSDFLYSGSTPVTSLQFCIAFDVLDMDYSSNIYQAQFNFRPTSTLRLDILRDLSILDGFNDQAQDSINEHESIESQWTGSMTENFNSLDLEDFTFPNGLISAFALITGIFNDLWNAMGEYKILFVFPLCLGIVLLLIGRISKFDFSDRSGGSGGSGPPAVI